MSNAHATRWFADGDHPAVGLFRFPPVDPGTGEVSASDDAILMGQMPHSVVPERFRRDDCEHLMRDHGYIDLGTTGHTVCPGDWITAAGLPA